MTLKYFCRRCFKIERFLNVFSLQHGTHLITALYLCFSLIFPICWISKFISIIRSTDFNWEDFVIDTDFWIVLYKLLFLSFGVISCVLALIGLKYREKFLIPLIIYIGLWTLKSHCIIFYEIYTSLSIVKWNPVEIYDIAIQRNARDLLSCINYVQYVPIFYCSVLFLNFAVLLGYHFTCVVYSRYEELARSREMSQNSFLPEEVMFTALYQHNVRRRRSRKSRNEHFFVLHT